MERRFNFSTDEYYHVFSRGVEKRTIFEETNDYDRFQKLLYLCNGEKPVIFRLIQGLPLDEVERGEVLTDIFAYSLMPNHIHLILRERGDKQISKFMGKVMTAYSMYFNKKYERSGPLFVHPFRARHIDNDPYFRWVFSYVHLNPISLIEHGWEESGIKNRENIRTFLNNYKYSSFYDYSVGNRPERLLLLSENIPDFLVEQNDLEDLLSWNRDFNNQDVIQG